MFKWRLYGRGWTFSDVDGEPWESPPWGVVVVAQPFAELHSWVLQNGHAFLWRVDEQEWSEVENETGERDQQAHFAHLIHAVRYGRWIDKPSFRKIQLRAEREVAEIRRAMGLSV